MIGLLLLYLDKLYLFFMWKWRNSCAVKTVLLQ